MMRAFIPACVLVIACGGAAPATQKPQGSPFPPAQYPQGGGGGGYGAGGADPAPVGGGRDIGGGGGPVLGGSKESAIPVCDVRGEYDYLGRLVCPGGDRPEYHRTGNVGARGDGHIVDRYAVQCADGEHEVYLDMYHCGEAPTTAVPPGFRLDR